MTMTLRSTPHRGRLVALAGAAALTLALAGCGGGNSGPSISNINASGLAYSRTATITANGSGLADPTLFMTVEGLPCENITRASGSSDSQVQFTCVIRGVGEMSPRIRMSDGKELGRVALSVPLPRVSFAIRRENVTSNVLIEMDPRLAPRTVANFISYVELGFYRDTLIHRVLTGQIAQGGGFTSGPTPKAALFPAIPLESNNGVKNLRGTIAMARSALPDSAQAQYYFNIKDNPEFDRVSDEQPGYAVFGTVIEGQDVLDAIGQVVTTEASPTLQNLPVNNIVVTSVLQVR
jgi:peptidyl-prolyl cis-trans isomerase A (cyclophilin A)